ncbi:hypothetical protein TNCV_3962561 [Trichonephila clavipes]|nr:hypothetical protein TNCV_3962561 [Trichonephila clavipes]
MASCRAGEGTSTKSVAHSFENMSPDSIRPRHSDPASMQMKSSMRQFAVMTLSPGLGQAGRRGRGTALRVRNRRSRSFLFSVTRDSDLIAR